MTQDKSWSDLLEESGEAVGPLPDSEYNFIIRKVTAKQSSNGKPMYMARCEVEDGQYAKRTVFHNFVVSAENPDAMRIFFQQMGALGFTKEFWKQNPSDDRVSQALEGRRFRATTVIRQWQGEDRNNLSRLKAAIQGPGTGAPPPPAGGVAPGPAPAPATPSPGAPPAPNVPTAQAPTPPPPVAVSPSPEAPGQPAQPQPTSPDPASPSVPAPPAPAADPTQAPNPGPATNPTTTPSTPTQTPSAPTPPSTPNQTPSSQTNGHAPVPDLAAATQAAEQYAAQGAAAAPAPQGTAVLPPPPAVADPPF